MDNRYKKFITVVELGSFSAAAKHLHVSQPAITIAIASLERSLGKKLFVRHKRTIELTADGEIVLQTAKRIDQEIMNMHSQLQSNTKSSRTHVGFIDSIAYLLYSSPKEKPLLSNIEVMVDNSSRIINDLVTKQIDFGFITGQPTSLTKDITVHKLRDESFVFVTSPNKAPPRAVTKIDNWLAFNQDSTTYRHFTRQFKKYGLCVNPTFYATSMELLKKMAIAGEGVALLPHHFVQDDIASNKLAIVRTQPMLRPIWIIARKDSTKPGLLEPLAQKINLLLSAK